MYKIFGLVILVVVFAAGFFGAEKYISLLIKNNSQAATPIASPVSDCGVDCQNTIKNQVNQAFASISGLPKISPSPQQFSTHGVQFIPLGNSFSTTNQDWVDVPGTDVTFDIGKDYSKGATIAWQTALKVNNGNGQAFARLFDETHGIAVSGSEISTSQNSDYQTVYSGNLNLWSGSINYRVQIKSLNSFEVFYTGGKIKISY